MTGALDTIARKAASNNIAYTGKKIAYTRVTQGAYDPATATAANTKTTTTVAVIVEEVNGRTFMGNAILAEDKQITIAALNFAKPNILDTFAIDEDTFTVDGNGIKTIFSGELACMYIVHGHKA